MCSDSLARDCPGGSATPQWIYDVSPRVLFKRGLDSPQALESAPYYLDPTFQSRFERLIREFVRHVAALPGELKSHIWGVQAALGITGDSRPWDGVPVNSSYVITSPQWIQYCRQMAEFFLGELSSINISTF